MNIVLKIPQYVPRFLSDPSIARSVVYTTLGEGRSEQSTRNSVHATSNIVGGGGLDTAAEASRSDAPIAISSLGSVPLIMIAVLPSSSPHVQWV